MLLFDVVKTVMSSSNKRKLDRLRVAVLGRSGSGKTALTVRYLTRRFIGDYERNKENTYQQDVEIDGQRISLEILDTTLEMQQGRVTNSNSLERAVKWADAFIVMYDVTDTKSLHIVTDIKAVIDQLRKSRAPTILVGNKMDMVRSRVVTPKEGEDMAQQLGIPFFEVSVRESYEGIAECFSRLVVDCRGMSSKPSMLKGLWDLSRKRGRFAMLTRQRSVTM
ncbi:ras-like protein family member 11B [Asterias amurensis]|uniref:ras-like protein family member 11B n=1 Tax=Asterias amurensis TaxID=7602 RepID=UPI003AB3F60F